MTRWTFWSDPCRLVTPDAVGIVWSLPRVDKARRVRCRLLTMQYGSSRTELLVSLGMRCRYFDVKLLSVS